MKHDSATRSPGPGEPTAHVFGIALGGGGARGLAHVPMLEVLDELGVRPHCIAGTSIGAILGALYASGHSAREIRELVEELVRAERKEVQHALVKLNIFKWVELIDPALGKGGLIDADHFMGLLHQAIKQTTFEELRIPLKVVATDYWSGEQVVFDTGDLLGAVKASMALPGVFAPVESGERLLVDGGAVNPVPFDLLDDNCIAIAVDVTGTLQSRAHVTPDFFESIFRTVRIMEHAVVQEKLKRKPPGIYIKPDLRNIKTLEFDKREQIYRQAAPARDELRRQLEKLLV